MYIVFLEQDIARVTDELAKDTRMASSELEVTMERLAAEERNTTLSEETTAESNLPMDNVQRKEKAVIDSTDFADEEEDGFS